MTDKKTYRSPFQDDEGSPQDAQHPAQESIARYLTRLTSSLFDFLNAFTAFIAVGLGVLLIVCQIFGWNPPFDLPTFKEVTNGPSNHN